MSPLLHFCSLLPTVSTPPLTTNKMEAHSANNHQLQPEDSESGTSSSQSPLRTPSPGTGLPLPPPVAATPLGGGAQTSPGKTSQGDTIFSPGVARPMPQIVDHLNSTGDQQQPANPRRGVAVEDLELKPQSFAQEARGSRYRNGYDANPEGFCRQYLQDPAASAAHPGAATGTEQHTDREPVPPPPPLPPPSAHHHDHPNGDGANTQVAHSSPSTFERLFPQDAWGHTRLHTPYNSRPPPPANISQGTPQCHNRYYVFGCPLCESEEWKLVCHECHKRICPDCRSAGHDAAMHHPPCASQMRPPYCDWAPLHPASLPPVQEPDRTRR